MPRSLWITPGRRIAVGSIVLLVVLVLGGASVAAVTPGRPRPEKEAELGRIATREAGLAATAAAHRAAYPDWTPTLPPTPSPWPTEPPLMGIKRADSQHPFRLTANATSLWGGSVNGTYLQVYAGSYLKEPDLGFVGVVVPSRTPRERPNDYTIRQYRTPVTAGPLTIIAVDGTSRMTLRAQDGTTFVFDLPSRTFVGGPRPTATPTVAPTRARQTRTAPPTRWAATPAAPRATRTPGPAQRPADVDTTPRVDEAP